MNVANGFIYRVSGMAGAEQARTEELRRLMATEYADGELPKALDLQAGKLILREGREIAVQKDSETFLELQALFNGCTCAEASEVAKATAQRQVAPVGQDRSKLFSVRVDRVLDTVRAGLGGIFPCQYFSSNNTVVVNVGIGLGAVSVLEVLAGHKEKKYATSIGDNEGVWRGRFAILKGAMATAGSVLFITAKKVGEAALLPLSYALFGITTLVAAFNSVQSFKSCWVFHKALHKIYGEAPKKENVEKTLRFLIDCLKRKDGNSERWELWLKRRTSQRSVDLIKKHAQHLLDAIQNGNEDAITQAKNLIDTVKKDNLVKRVMHVVSATASLFCFAAALASMANPASHAALVLYGMSMAFSLGGTALSVMGKVAQWQHKRRMEKMIQDVKNQGTLVFSNDPMVPSAVLKDPKKEAHVDRVFELLNGGERIKPSHGDGLPAGPGASAKVRKRRMAVTPSGEDLAIRALLATEEVRALEHLPRVSGS